MPFTARQTPARTSPGRGWRRSIGLGLLAALCFGTAATATHALRAHGPVADAEQELMYFPAGSLLNAVAVGDNLMAADLVWLRGLQYYGRHRLTDRRFDHIGHIFDVATRLDPHFVNAYIFGGLTLAAEGDDFDGAIRLMQRGLANNPDSYLLAFEIGFLYHVGRRDYAHAAYYYKRALRHPDCPEHVRRFAAFACQRTHRPGEALALWEEMARTSTIPTMRRLAEERVAELRAAMGQSRGTEVVD